MLDRKVYINSIAGISPSMAAKGFPDVGEPDYKEYVPDPGARRRMSRIIRMGVASALMCLKDNHINSLDGIITGTGWGCLSDTEKFLNSIFENSERMLNPTSFIQSTSNTIGAQVALLTGEKNYNNTFVHGGTSFEAAMIDALLKLQEDSCDNILVGGLDEMTPTKSHLLGRMGVWRHTSPGEGSHFFVLSSAKEISSIAEIVSVETFSSAGLPAGYKLECNQIDRILSGVANLGELTTDAKPQVVNFKEFCGEYPTSTAFALWLACDTINKEHDINRILIVNKHLRDQLSLIIIKRAGL